LYRYFIHKKKTATTRLLTTRVQYFSEQIGLQINENKTKIMYFADVDNIIKFNDNVLEKVQNFTYIGSRISTNGDSNRNQD
jgi:hypothetical protein